MQHARIIADLGGYQSVARALRVKPKLVWRWAQLRNIPVARWAAVVRLARAQGLPHITLEALLTGYGPGREPANDGGRSGGVSRAAA